MAQNPTNPHDRNYVNNLYEMIYDRCEKSSKNLTEDPTSLMISSNYAASMIITLLAHEVINKYLTILLPNAKTEPDNYVMTIPRDIINIILPMAQTDETFAGYKHSFTSDDLKYGCFIGSGLHRIKNRKYILDKGIIMRSQNDLGSDVSLNRNGYKHGLTVDFKNDPMIYMHWFHGRLWSYYTHEDESVSYWNIFENDKQYECIGDHTNTEFMAMVRRSAFVRNHLD